MFNGNALVLALVLLMILAGGACVPAGTQAPPAQSPAHGPSGPQSAYCQQFSPAELEFRYDPLRQLDGGRASQSMAKEIWQWAGKNPFSPMFNRFVIRSFGAFGPIFVIREALAERPIPLAQRFDQFCDLVALTLTGVTGSDWESQIRELAQQTQSRQEELFKAVWCTRTGHPPRATPNPYLDFLTELFFSSSLNMVEVPPIPRSAELERILGQSLPQRPVAETLDGVGGVAFGLHSDLVLGRVFAAQSWSRNFGAWPTRERLARC